MNKVALLGLTLAANLTLIPAPAVAKGKKAKKPAAQMEALPPRVLIYDAASPAGPAKFAKAEEPKVPDAPRLSVSVDKEAGKGVATEQDVAIEKGKKK